MRTVNPQFRHIVLRLTALFCRSLLTLTRQLVLQFGMLLFRLLFTTINLQLAHGILNTPGCLVMMNVSNYLHILNPLDGTPYSNSTSQVTVKALDAVTVSCLIGYEMPDQHKEIMTVCVGDDVWLTDSSLLPTCSITHCPYPPDVANTTKSTQENQFATLVNYTCINGTYFKDVTTFRQIRCLVTKHWNAKVDSCGDKVKRELVKPPLKEAASASAIGMVMVCLLFGIIFGLIILDFATLGYHLRLMRENLQHLQHTLHLRAARNRPVYFEHLDHPDDNGEVGMEMEQTYRKAESKEVIEYRARLITSFIMGYSRAAAYKPARSGKAAAAAH